MVDYNMHISREWDRLKCTASALDPSLVGTIQNLIVEPFGDAVHQGPNVLTRAYVVEPCSRHTTEHKVVLKVSSADWVACSCRVGALKVLQTRISLDTDGFWLDATQVGSFLVAVAPLTTETVAEIFSGGFAGWTQAISVMQRQGVPIHVAWQLDCCEDAHAMLRPQQPDLSVVSAPEDLKPSLEDPKPLQLCVDFRERWWMQVALYRPPNIMTFSAPCPPLSRAPRQGGLCTSDGRLLIGVARVLALLEPSVALIEQVEGFGLHPHYPRVLQEFSQAGYDLCWRSTQDLGELLPSSRKRHLMVFRHIRHRELPLCESCAWHPAIMPSLQQAEAILEVPFPLLQEAVPSAEVLAKYLDPHYVPASRATGQRKQSPRRYRLRSKSERVGCMMAQYTQQHKLPDQFLAERGILGQLYCQGDLVRFFTWPEVAVMLGMTRPILLTGRSETDFRLLGNAIAVPHSTLALIQGLHSLGLPDLPTVPEAVASALAARIKRSNATFLPHRQGWIMCNQDQVPEMLAAIMRCPPGPDTFAAGRRVFAEVRLSAPSTAMTVWASASCDLGQLQDHLGCKIVGKDTGPLLRQPIWVQGVPVLTCRGRHHFDLLHAPLSTVLTGDAWYVLQRLAPTTWMEVFAVALHTFQDPTMWPFIVSPVSPSPRRPNFRLCALHALSMRRFLFPSYRSVSRRRCS